MEIGKVIRKYRKEKDMTQEEMARRLGVTAPAVNKWENGNSMPDIALLAPIARLLDITLDTLLSFREELTEEEIRQYVREAGERLQSGSYEEAFQWGKSILEQYPNCDRLSQQLALLFDVQRLTGEVPDAERYDAYIIDCYTRALDNEDEDIRVHAAASLYGFYFRKEQYDKAETYLAYYSSQNPERTRKQGDIYAKTGRTEEAYKIYEQQLFSEYQRIVLLLQNIYLLAAEEKNLEKMRLVIEKQGAFARLFEMGEYQQASFQLQLAVLEQDADATIEIVEKLLASLGSLTDYSRSPLYGHMEFRELREEFVASMKENLLKSCREDETLGYLKGDERWQTLVGC